MKGKKVLVVVDNNLDSDVRVLKEIRMLLDLGAEVLVVCFGFGPTIEYPNFKVHRLQLPKLLKDVLFFLNLILPFYEWYWIVNLKSILRKNSVDFVHCHDLYLSRIASKSASSRFPVILDLHENYPAAYASYSWTNKRWKKWITKPKGWFPRERKYLGYADGLIFLSEEFQRKTYSKFSELEGKPHLILPNIPDLTVFNESVDELPKPRYLSLFYFGVVARRRGIFDVLKVFAEVLEVNPNIRLEIIGPVDKTEQMEFESLLARLPKSNVHYIPWIQLKDLPQYMANAHVGLAPFEKNEQHDSGVANKIFQYMYGNLALLVSDSRPQAKLVEVNDIGWVFHNKDELKATILSMARDLEAVIEKGRRARKLLTTKYALSNFEKPLGDFYREVGMETTRQVTTK